jgi:hypothetical protein
MFSRPRRYKTHRHSWCSIGCTEHIPQDGAVDLWAEWNDPVELRIRLDLALVEIAELREENEHLRGLLANAMLREAIGRRGQMSLASYDRLFPAQDSLPTSALPRFRFGNLIALPLQGTCRESGTTIFCTADTWTPYPDQFAYLSTLSRLHPAEVQALADRYGQIQAGPSASGTLAARPRRVRSDTRRRLSRPGSVPCSRSPPAACRRSWLPR